MSPATSAHLHVAALSAGGGLVVVAFLRRLKICVLLLLLLVRMMVHLIALVCVLVLYQLKENVFLTAHARLLSVRLAAFGRARGELLTSAAVFIHVVEQERVVGHLAALRRASAAYHRICIIADAN